MMKVRILALLVLVIICGCENDMNRTSDIHSSISNLEQTKLNIMGHWYGEGKKELLVREMVREFSLRNQNYDINLKFSPQIYTNLQGLDIYNAEVDSIVKMVQKDYWPWDILFVDKARYESVGDKLGDPTWGKSYLVDFSDKPWFKESHKDGIFETPIESYGIIPGPLLEGATFILFLSEEIKQRVGITVKELDMTSEDFLEYAKAVYNYNETHSDKVTFLSSQLSSALDLLFTQLVLSSYGKNEPGMRQEGLVALEKAYSYFEELSKYKPFEQFGGYAGNTWDASKRNLYEDRFLFNMQPTWIYLLWENSNPKGVKKLSPCEIPSMHGGVSPNYPGYYQFIFVVPKYAKNSEGAEKFIKFISSSETADKWIGYSKCPTGLVSGISYTDFGQDKFDIFFRHIHEKYGNHQKEIILSEYLFKTNKTVYFYPNEVITGKMSAKEALNSVVNQL